jgi:glutamate/aspartate transport system substrate-binding protein
MDDRDAFRMLQSGRARAFAMDDVLLRMEQADSKVAADELEISAESFSIEPYALGLAPGDIAFKQLIDGVLAGIFQSGEIFKLYQKWFQSPIPPKGVNLNLPISAAFRRAISKPTDSADPAAYQ